MEFDVHHNGNLLQADQNESISSRVQAQKYEIISEFYLSFSSLPEMIIAMEVFSFRIVASSFSATLTSQRTPAFEVERALPWRGSDEQTWKAPQCTG